MIADKTPTFDIAEPKAGAGIRRPKHLKIFQAFLKQIESGQIRPGERIPTEAEISKTFSASRATVARAMRELKGRGLLDRQRGGGTRIASQQKSSKRIALFVPFVRTVSELGFIGGSIHAHLSNLASESADDLRLQFLVRGPDTLVGQMLAAADELIARRVSGVFYYPAELPAEVSGANRMVVEKLRTACIPVILVDRDIVAYPRRSGLPLVTFNNRYSGYLLTDHLIQRGCRRIAFVSTPYVSSAASDRLRGYADALDHNGLRGDRDFIVRARIQELDVEFCQRLMQTVRPDAIICKIDHYSAAFGRHLSEMGLKIGRDIMLAGFDDQPIAEALPVPLTSIRFPVEPFASISYQRLSRQIADPTYTDPGLTLIDVELVVRASTGGAIAPTEKADAGRSARPIVS